MHYAAATRDGGHYLKILSKAGADPLAVDNVTFAAFFFANFRKDDIVDKSDRQLVQISV